MAFERLLRGAMCGFFAWRKRLRGVKKRTENRTLCQLYVFVCVCERDTARERERARERVCFGAVCPLSQICRARVMKSATSESKPSKLTGEP